MITQYLQQILHLSCRVQPLPPFQALCPCQVFLKFCKFREVSSLAVCLKDV